MSEVKVNKISPRTNCGTVQLGDSGDTITIPAGATITNNGTQTGFGRTGTVDWDTTAKTASFTAVSGNGYFVNTTSGAITVTLPAGSAGDIVSLADYAATWQTNNVTVTPNGTDKIGSANTSVTLSTEGQSVTFVYTDSTQGWINTMDSTSNVRGNLFIVATGGTETTCGDCKIHTFTSPGTFCVSAVAACSTNNIVSYVVVAGGGGGTSSRGGGGGAGGYREVKSPVTPYTASPLDGYPSAPNRVTVTATAFPITVGAGGAGGDPAANGSNSIFSTITSAGGGGSCAGSPGAGRPGGSGGGAEGRFPGSGGTGNTPPVSPSQGNNGGNASGTEASPDIYAGGGGGGAGAAGSPNPSGTQAGAGGAGVSTSITGSSVARAGGGGGGAGSSSGGTSSSGGAGGSGGGAPGKGSSDSPVEGVNGTVNTGGGGGGAGLNTPPGGTGGSGGSGIVIIRYKYQ
jgi:hypothetical protein